MNLRQGDTLEEKEEIKHQRKPRFELTLEGAATLLVAILSIAYTAGFVTSDVKQNAKDIEAQRQLLVAHIAQDEAKNDKVSDKLDEILARLGKIEGRIDGERDGRRDNLHP